MPDLLPGGVLPPGQPTIDVASVSSLRPMDPNAKTKLAAQNDPFAGLEPVETPAKADPFAGLEPAGDSFSNLTPADDLDLKDEQALVDDDAFNPADYLSSNPGISTDAEKSKKLINVYRARRIRGLEAGKVLKVAVTETPGIIGKVAGGVGDLVSRAVTLGVQPTANKLFGFLTGLSPEEQAAVDAEGGKQQLKAASELTAGSETAVTGLAQLAQQGGRKLFGKSPEKATDSELLNDLYTDSEFSKSMKALSEGSGDASKLLGLDADLLSKNGITLDKEAIERLSLVDPVTLVGTAGVFKVVGLGGKVLATAATKLGAEAVVGGIHTAAAKALELAGRGAQAAGKGAAGVAEKIPAKAIGAALGGAQTGTLTGAAVGAAAGEAAKRITVELGESAARRGAQVAEIGRQIAPGFTGPKTAAVQRLSNILASAPAQVAKGVAKGAAAGVVSSAPLALAADDSNTAGALLGAGAGLGGIAGGAARAKSVAVESVAKNYLDPTKVSFQQVKSPGYGIDTKLDASHEAAVKNLTPDEQNALNNFREGVRAAGGEIYAQDAASYLERVREQLLSDNGGQPLTPEQEATAKLYAQTHATFDAIRTDANGNPRRAVFLNSDTKGLPHDAGHLFQSLLSPDRQTELRDTVFKSYSPEQLKAFQDDYAARLGDPDYFNRLGDEAGKAKAADELIAENYGQLFRNTPLTDLRAPRSFLQKLGQTALDAAEALGVDLTGGRVTPDLQVAPSYRLQGILRSAAQEVLTRPEAPFEGPKNAPPAPEVKPTPVQRPPLDLPAPRSLEMKAASPITPEEINPASEVPAPESTAPETVIPTPEAKPGEPTGARNIRTTPEAQSDFASKRAEETGISAAQKSTEGSPETRATVDTIAKSMQEGNPVLEIEHRGIASERGPGSPEARTSRRSTQEQAYTQLEDLRVENRQNAPADIVEAHQKTFVPVRFVEQGGKPTLIAMSLDKVISNVNRVVSDAVTNGAEKLIPYPVENGKLTEAGWRRVVDDVKAYAENQSNGYRGDGKKLVRPAEDIGVSIPAENPNYTPKPLSEAAMNFSNLLQGLNPPETGRVQKGLTPGNVKGQIVAEINARQPMTPSVISPDKVAKQGFKGFDRSVKETNPLRNELAARGVKVRELLEVTERVAVEDIAKVNPRPEIGFKAPVTDTIRAGFLPESPLDAEIKRRLDEKQKAGIDLTETVRRKAREEAETAIRNGTAGKAAPNKAAFFLPGAETDRAVRAGFLPDPKPSQPSPDASIRGIATAYAKAAGVDYKPARSYAEVNPSLSKRLADFYESAQSAPADPTVKASYDALTREVLAQHKAITDAGYVIEPFKGAGEPYASSADAVADIRDNKHLYFLSTDSAFSGSDPTNPMLADSGVSFNGKAAPVNDIFRAVHDFFGHGKEGYQFGPRGEFNAWRAHSEMFSPEAQGALAAETLAQNSWVNFGPHLRDGAGNIPIKGEAGYKAPTDRPFATQKNVLIPEALIEEARTQAGKTGEPVRSIDELGEHLSGLDQTGWREWTQSKDGGLTGEAYRMGLAAPDEAYVAKLAEWRDKMTQTFRDKMAAGDLEAAYPFATKAQLFSEAFGAATGGASARKGFSVMGIPESSIPFPEYGKGTKGSFLPGREPSPIDAEVTRRLEEKKKSGIPVTEAVRAKTRQEVEFDSRNGRLQKPKESMASFFLPATEAGKKLAERGYEFQVSGELGAREVAILKDGSIIGRITSRQKNPKSAEVAMVQINKSDRAKGLGEALYRELFSQLRDDKVELVEGTVVAPQPLAIRNKIFLGKFERLEHNAEPIGVEDAIAQAERIPNNVTELIDIEAVNRITPDMKFLPDDVQPKKPAAVDVTRLESSDLPRSFWVAPGGEVYEAKNHHREFATKFIVPDSSDPVKDAVDAGWARVNVSPMAGEILVEGNNQSRKQGSAISDLSAVLKLPVSDDSGRPVEGGFLPREKKEPARDERGNPLTREGLIDYPKLYKEMATEKETSRLRDEATTDYSKYNVPASQKPKENLTGWILPNQKYVPLDTAYHEQFLAKNAKQLNADFGTELGETPDAQERLGALDKGFVRVRYTPNDGALRLEMSARQWTPKAKRAVLDHLATAVDSIDRVYATLLDEAGGVVDSVNEIVSQLDGPEKLTALEDSIRGLRKSRMGGSFLPAEERALPGFAERGGTSPEQRDARNRVAESRGHPEAQPLEFIKEGDGSYRMQNGRPVPVRKDYDLAGSSLSKESAKGIRGEGPREEALTDALAGKLVKTYKQAVKNPEIKAGEKWYSTARSRLKRLLGDDTKLFTELLGATSARTAVDLNFKFALEAYNQFKAGAYDAILDKYREGKREFDAGSFGDFAKATGQTETPTRAAFLDWWIESNKLTPLQSNGKKFGMNSRPVLKVLDGSWASEVGGPKTPNFTGNLSGATFEATVDVWAMRMLHRLANEGSGKRWRIQPSNETGVTDRDFFTGQKAFRKAADALGIKPDALQAVLWFAEKDYWEKQGWNRSSTSDAKSDFNSLLAETERTPSGKLRRKADGAELDLGLSEDDIKPKKK